MLSRALPVAAFVAFVTGLVACTPAARAQIFTDIFGIPVSVGRARAAEPTIHDDESRTRLTVRKSFSAPAKTFCVRSCDGRYFSVASGEKNTCKIICPGAETKLYKGSSIETATGPDGKVYAKAKNAFRFRNEFVNSCSCLSNSSTGLSYVSIKDDPTIRKGDIIADASGLMVATGSGSRVIFRPIAKSRLRAEKLPSVAAR